MKTVGCCQSTRPATHSSSSNVNSTPPPKRKKDQDLLTKNDFLTIVQAVLEALPGSTSQPSTTMDTAAASSQSFTTEACGTALSNHLTTEQHDTNTAILPEGQHVEYLSMLTPVSRLYVGLGNIPDKG